MRTLHSGDDADRPHWLSVRPRSKHGVRASVEEPERHRVCGESAGLREYRASCRMDAGRADRNHRAIAFGVIRRRHNQVNWVTVLATAAAAAAPAFVSALPPQYAGVLSGVIAGLSALYHLYRTSPSDK
jgi:hypothetical protein